jgi:sensor histidine kinase YesM
MKRWIKIVIWVAFWTIAYFVLLNIFASSSQWQKIDFIYTSVFTATLIGAVAVSEYSRRRLLLTKRYGLWALSVIFILAAFSFVNQIIFAKLIDFVLPGYYFISYYSYFDLFKFFGSFLVLTTLISLSIEWFQLEKEKATAEFKALVNQVNPHFLFNSLTVLYSLSLNDRKETSSAIIKLSDILRYVIYKSSDNRVSLVSEAEILRDYIDLQRYRVHPATKIDYVEQLNGDVQVAPMLFLPLLENAFKHGETVISMELKCERNVVNFNITNNKSKVRSMAGIGLKNLKERLSLLYPRQHLFVINETENEFSVSMQISL